MRKSNQRILSSGNMDFMTLKVGQGYSESWTKPSRLSREMAQISLLGLWTWETGGYRTNGKLGRNGVVCQF